MVHQKIDSEITPAEGALSEKRAYKPLGHQPGLDGLRGIAVICVVAVHMFPQYARGGAVGVDIFFVLSGFLITCILLEEYANTGRIQYVMFMKRRVLRLIPALWMLLFTYLIYRWFIDSGLLEFKYSIIRVVINGVFLTNWCYLFRWYPLCELGYPWSLSVEWQFYLVWPLILILTLRWNTRTIIFLVGLLLVGAMAHAFCVGLRDVRYAYFATDTRVHQLILGAFIALLYHNRLLPSLGRSGSVLGLISLVVIAVHVFFPLSSIIEDNIVVAATLPVLGFVSALLVMIAVQGKSGWYINFLSWRPLRYIGKISYGLFLWHALVLSMVDDQLTEMSFVTRRLLTMMLFTIATLLSYYFIELKFIKYKAGRSSSKTSTRVIIL